MVGSQAAVVGSRRHLLVPSAVVVVEAAVAAWVAVWQVAGMPVVVGVGTLHLRFYPL